MRHWDIKIVVLLGLGVAALGLVVLLESFALNNIPDENVVYIDPTVGSVDSDPRSGDALRVPGDSALSESAPD